MSERPAHQVVKGYELSERIGSGVFGAVYRAYQYSVGREVAVKIIQPGFANHPDFIRRFETEAQLVARLEHLHIVPLYDYWRDPSGAYLVMRWLRGGSLAAALQIHPLELASAVKLFNQIASGLAVAHRKEIVHRDLKPSNILLDEEGNGYLADFSIARDIGLPAAGLEELKGIVGSPGYLSPEQIRGELVSPQSDIYSLGVLLYEMLSGRHPFPGPLPEDLLRRHLNDPLPLIETLPLDVREGVNAVIQKATQKNPHHRYPDVLEMAIALQQEASPGEREPESTPAEQFTLREAEILGRIVAGHSNKQIARDLFVEPSTIKWHITQIYHKLQVRTRYQAILRAREMQLIFPGQEREAGKVSDEALGRSIDLTGPGLTNPYKGLRPFETADSRDFYGREDSIKKLVGRLAESDPYARFLAIVGPSGCGKSSLVKAGLIPALRRGALAGSDQWFIVEMEPGAQPIDNLEIALTRVAADNTVNIRAELERDECGLLLAAGLILPPDNSQLLICIDQFEEIFSLVQAETLRGQFLNLLTAAVSGPNSRVRLLMTLRADYYDRPLQYPAFGELVRCRMETVLPLNPSEIERAILLPAQRAGVIFEPSLTASIVKEVSYQPGALPLLQYALTELFDRREDGCLTRQAYQAIGGAVGALANRAEEIYNQLDPENQQAARQTFLQLVALGEAEDGNGVLADTRRRAFRADLLASTDDAETLDELIDTYAAYRLLTLDIDPESHQPTVALAHEALIREWERLRLWLENSREDLLQHRRLSTLNREWQEAGQDPGYLLRQSRLDRFSAWAARTDLRLSPQEKEFLEASQAGRHARRAAEADRQRREATRKRLVRNVLRALGVVFLLVALGSYVLTWNARKQAELTTSRELAGMAIANLEADPELSILLSLQALRTVYTREAEDALRSALPASRVRMALTGHTNGARSVEFSPDGKTILTTSNAGQVIVWEASSGQQLFSLPGTIARYSPDGARLATGNLDGRVAIWDLDSREELLAIAGHNQRVYEVHFSPDGRLLVSTSEDDVLKVWDTETGREVFSREAKYSGYISILHEAVFSPDGQLLISTDFYGPDEIDMRIWGVDQDWALLNQSSGYWGITFSPDGRWLAAPGEETGTELRLWDLSKLSSTDLTSLDLSTVEPVIVPGIRDAPILDITFNTQGSLLATGSQDGRADIWQVSSDRLNLLMTLSGHTKEIAEVAFSPDGAWLATASDDGSVRIWGITPEGAAEWFNLTAHDGNILYFELTPDGKYLATASYDGAAKVWDLASRQLLLAVTEHGGPLNAASISADGSLLATCGTDNIAKIWEMQLSPGEATARLLHTFRGHSAGPLIGGKWSGIMALFSPDGTKLATGGTDGMVKIWDVSTGQELLSLQPHPERSGVGMLAYSPDGRLLAAATAASDDRNALVKIWDAASGEEIVTFSDPSRIAELAGLIFSPDGERIATGSEWGSLKIWDVKTGKELQDFNNRTGKISGMNFSQDGKYLVSSSTNGTLTVWDATSGKNLKEFALHKGVYFYADFTPDGKKVIASGFRTIYGYIIDTQELIATANSRLTRWFTSEECRQYLHLDECPPQ